MAAEDFNMSQDSSSNPLSGLDEDKTPSSLDQESLSAVVAVAPPTAATAPPTSGLHRAYHGIRFRRGKWVSEIRKPRKSTRIWLGTYPTQEMAAAAYDVAAMALKGQEAKINFPSLAPTYPLPASYSSADICTAAASAAAAMAPRRAHPAGDQIQILRPPGNVNAASSSVPAAPPGHEFIDDEALFDMPKLLEEMAEGMLMSPPRMESAADNEESQENYSGDDSLWNYS